MSMKSMFMNSLRCLWIDKTVYLESEKPYNTNSNPETTNLPHIKYSRAFTKMFSSRSFFYTTLIRFFKKINTFFMFCFVFYSTNVFTFASKPKVSVKIIRGNQLVD